MSKRLAALSLAVGAALLAACAGHGATSAGTGTTSFLLPSYDKNVAVIATLPQNTIGEELPSEGLGTINDPHWKALVGGYTQTNYSQVLGFPPGTQLTLENLSKSISHTLNVVKKVKRPPAKFPSNPTLSTGAQGNGQLQQGYASGIISPGKSVTVTLAKAGFYLIGCAFHYKEGMRDVLVVKAHATPGPEATPPVR